MVLGLITLTGTGSRLQQAAQGGEGFRVLTEHVGKKDSPQVRQSLHMQGNTSAAGRLVMMTHPALLTGLEVPLALAGLPGAPPGEPNPPRLLAALPGRGGSAEGARGAAAAVTPPCDGVGLWDASAPAPAAAERLGPPVTPLKMSFFDVLAAG